MKRLFPNTPEFQFIEKLRCQHDTNSVNQIGDDCVLIDQRIFSKDIMAEGSHYNLNWMSIEEIIEKLFLVNISDINAMGGSPDKALAGVCLNRNWSSSFIQRVAESFKNNALKYEIELIGGDTTAADYSFFSLTISAPAPDHLLKRANARAGDKVYLTGATGLSAAGLHCLNQNLIQPYSSLIQAHKKPDVPLKFGSLLSSMTKRTAAIDVSDGLSSELHHLAFQSEVKIQVYERDIPVHPELKQFCQNQRLDLWDFILNGGEDYQMLFTTSEPIPDSKSILVKTIPKSITCIGEVVLGSGVELIYSNGKKKLISAGGYSHL
jgi:thiamine-monophosphate kinase